MTAFHFAIDNEKIEAFRILLPFYAKFNIDIADATGMTPLHYALMIDNSEIIEKLMENGANVDKKDENGEDAMSLANTKQKEIMRKYMQK